MHIPTTPPQCKEFGPCTHKYTPKTPLQISGGHKYLPPRQDVNAPDLYIPAMAAWTYCILIGVASLAAGRFKPDIVYNTVGEWVGVGGGWGSGANAYGYVFREGRGGGREGEQARQPELGGPVGQVMRMMLQCSCIHAVQPRAAAPLQLQCHSLFCGPPAPRPTHPSPSTHTHPTLPPLQASGTLLAWLLHTLLLKVTLHLLGIASAVPFLELAAYAGYCFVAGCASLLAAMTLGGSLMG